MNQSCIESRNHRRCTAPYCAVLYCTVRNSLQPYDRIGISTYRILWPVRLRPPCACVPTIVMRHTTRLSLGSYGVSCDCKAEIEWKWTVFPCTQSVLFLQCAYRTSIDLIRDKRFTVRYDYGSVIAVMHEETSIAHGIQHRRREPGDRLRRGMRSKFSLMEA